MLFYLCRHGETDHNKGGKDSAELIRGWEDIPLNEQGKQTAKKTAESLKNKNIECLIASTLHRAEQTADIIGKIIHVKPTFSDKLKTWNLGSFIGKNAKDVANEIKRYVENPDKPIPQGEAFNTFKQRAFTGIIDAIDEANNDKLCIVTHHRVERLIKAWIEAGQPTDGTVDIDTFTQKGEPPGHVEVITLDPSRLRKITKRSVRQTVEKIVTDGHYR